MPLWNVKDFGATGRFNPSDPFHSTDDTAAILAALTFAATSNQWGTIYFPAGVYQITDKGWGTPASQSVLAVQIAGTVSNSFTLTIVAGTTGAAAQTYHTQPITFQGMNGQTASAIETAIQAIGAPLNTVSALYNSGNNWITVTFPSSSAASLGAPVMTGGGPGLTITVSMVQSGAALVAQNFSALRFLGDGAAYADYDLTTPTTVMSRSALVWNGSGNGILFHLLGCQDITIENLALWGAPSAGAANQARTGLLFSSAQGASASPPATRLTCRSAGFARFASTITPAAGGCVQLGMNPGDVGADTTVYHGCNFSYGTNGLLVASAGAVNHHLHGCGLDNMDAGAWFQQGGNLEWDGCKAHAVGAVLKIGTGAGGYFPSVGGGGSGSSTFLLRNVRTDPAGGPNVTVVDSAYASPGTTVTVEGWDDTASTPAAGIAFVQYGAQAAVNPSVAMPLAVTAGDTLIAFGAIRGTTLPSQTAISDNQGNTWVYVPNSFITTGTSVAAGAWYCARAAGGSTTVTFNSGSVSANLVVHEYSGVDRANPIDAIKTASGNSAAPSTGDLYTLYANEMVVAYTSQGTSNVTYSQGSGYALRASNGNGATIEAYASEDQLMASAGKYAAMFSTGTTFTPWVCIGLSLKPTGSGIALGAGSSVQLRDSLVNRQNLAEEAAGNPPNPTLTAALRLENLIVPEGQVAANLCQNLTSYTKVDSAAERTGTYNIIRPDVSTMIGRHRYSPLNWAILQQKPKLFYDLGDIGLVAPNQGWNLFLTAQPPRLDGLYAGSGIQNVQGLVATDAIGGFNTNGSGHGYVSLNNGGHSISLGQVAGKSWTLIAIAKQNNTGAVSPIISNLGASQAAGGLELHFDASGYIVFKSYNGNATFTLTSSTSITALAYIMIQVDAQAGVISLYLNGSPSANVTASFTGNSYVDNAQTPFIGASGTGTTPSAFGDIKVARVATFDLLVPLAAWTNLYNAGALSQGR